MGTYGGAGAPCHACGAGFGFGTGQNVTYGLKWQYSADKTSWSDVSGASSSSTWLGDSGSFGTIQEGAAPTGTKTGLTAGILAHFRLMYNITAGDSLIAARDFTIWAEGSADGS